MRSFFSSNRRVLSLLAIVTLLLVVLGLALWVFSLNEGSKKYIAFAFVIVSLPVCIWVAAIRPLVFPFAAYVFLVPFENLIDISSFGTLAKLVAAAAGAAIVLWLIRNRQFVPPGRAIVMWNLFLLWVALTVFWALDPIASIYYLITYTLLIVLMTAVSIMPVTAVDYQAIIFATIAGAFAASAYGIYLFHSGNSAFLEGGRLMIGLATGAKEARVDANAFGAGLLLPVAYVMVGALANKWSFKKLGFIAILLVLMGGMYASASRGALSAMAVMFGYFLLRSRYKAQLIVISTLAVLLSFFMPNSPWQRFSTALSGGGSGRLAIWRVGWEALKHHWLIGAGVGMYPQAYDEVLIRVYQSSFQQWDRVAHNTILQTAVELGIVGLILLILAWRAQWAGLRDLRRSGAISSDLVLILEASFIGVTVASVFLSVLTLKLVYLLLILIAVTRSLVLSQARAAGAVTLAPRVPAQLPIPLTARVPN